MKNIGKTNQGLIYIFTNHFNPRPPKGGVVCYPQAVLFSNNSFWQPKIAQRLYVVYINPIRHCSNMQRNLGVSNGRGNRQSRGGGGRVNTMIFILSITNIWRRYMFVTWYVDYNYYFLTYFAQKFCESCMVLQFFSQNRNFCLLFFCTLSRVIVTSSNGWYFFRINEKRRPMTAIQRGPRKCAHFIWDYISKTN